MRASIFEPSISASALPIYAEERISEGTRKGREKEREKARKREKEKKRKRESEKARKREREKDRER